MDLDPAALLARLPFAAHLGIELIAADPEQVRCSLEYAPQLCTVGGIMHGGALMSLADTAGAICAVLNLPPGATTATTSSTSNLLRAVTGGTVVATATPLRVGARVIVVETRLSTVDGLLAAVTTQSQQVLAPRVPPPGDERPR